MSNFNDLKNLTLSNWEIISYREEDLGDKTLLLTQGNMSHSKHWDILVDILKRKYKIIAIDMSGGEDINKFIRN